VRALLAALLLLTAACSSGGAGDRDLTVFAAASLSGAFPAIAEAFEREHPGVTVRLSFAGSQSLVAQVRQGAPADVLATADEASMRQVRDGARVFARNRLAIVVPRGRPVPILADLGQPTLKVVLGGPTVPVGRAARAALAAAHVPVRPVSEEPDVRSVLAKVVAGEADAAVVYATDLAAAGDSVDGAVLPGAVTSLPIVALSSSSDAAAFVRFVLSGEGQAELARRGFAPP
jgi:molybdate transport system substrate-binding protein